MITDQLSREITHVNSRQPIGTPAVNVCVEDMSASVLLWACSLHEGAVSLQAAACSVGVILSGSFRPIVSVAKGHVLHKHSTSYFKVKLVK